jgi:hypothetical protein
MKVSSTDLLKSFKWGIDSKRIESLVKLYFISKIA